MNDAASETQTIASTNNDKSRKTSTVLDDDIEIKKSEKDGGDLDTDEDDNCENDNFDIDDGIDEEFKEGSERNLFHLKKSRNILKRLGRRRKICWI